MAVYIGDVGIDRLVDRIDIVDNCLIDGINVLFQRLIDRVNLRLNFGGGLRQVVFNLLNRLVD